MSSHRLVIKDAAWQIIGRVASAIAGFFVIKIISPYLGPLRYGDYSTVLKYFAIWSALADFGIYVIAVKKLGQIKEGESDATKNLDDKEKKSILQDMFGKFVGTRIMIASVIYTIALVIAYFLPAYTSNPYLIRGLPFGMIFSASFMFAGILQLPLQIFWKMEKLSFGLIWARVVQLIILIVGVYVVFQKVEFNGSSVAIAAFCMIMLSVVASGVTQGIYVWKKSQKYLLLKIKFDFGFAKKLIKTNWQYGLSFYLSSFHTLIVLIFLSNMFPTSEGYALTGIWALGLFIIEIFLIIPSSLGNSLLHKVGAYTQINKQKSFGNLLSMIYWIGGILFANMLIFRKELVLFIGGTDFISTSRATPGTNHIIPFLAGILWLSFIKQVFNYIFVANEKQNKLLRINLTGVTIGITIGLWLIPIKGIIGGLITQGILEIMFVLGALRVAFRNKVFPKLSFKRIGLLTGIIALCSIGGYYYIQLGEYQLWKFITAGIVFNAILIGVSLPLIKKIARGLTIE